MEEVEIDSGVECVLDVKYYIMFGRLCRAKSTQPLAGDHPVYFYLLHDDKIM